MLKNKVAVITGASKGIGYAIAKEFAEKNGAKVVLCSRDLKRAQAAASTIRGKVRASRLDVTDPSDIKRFFAKLVRHHNAVDILVNNAGFTFYRKTWFQKFHEASIVDFQKVLEVDLKGSLMMSQAAISLMIEQNQGGVIINLSSTPALVGHSEGAPYTIAKAAVLGLTKHIAVEYGENGIRSYTLALGNIASQATLRSLTKSEKKKATKENVMKRWGSPEEVAKVAACLASESFSFATGNTVVIDGGTVFL